MQAFKMKGEFMDKIMIINMANKREREISSKGLDEVIENQNKVRKRKKNVEEGQKQ